jgi:uncharacterized protein (DUF58 family)
MLKVKRQLPLTLGAIALLAALAGGKFPYLFFYLAAMVFLVPCIRLRSSLGRLKGDVQVSSPYAEVGQSLKVRYRIINSTSGRFPYLELQDVVGGLTQARQVEIVNVNPGQTAVFEREVSCARRGKYDLKTLTVRTGDPFGFFQLEKSLAAGQEIRVYPRLQKFPEINIPPRHHFGDIRVKNPSFESYSEIASLREWRDGDSIKKIHWKQSAKVNSIVVKNYERKGDSSLTIFLDMHRKSYRHDSNHRLEDLAVEATASFVHVNLCDNLPLSVFCASAERSPLCGKSPGDYRGIMDHLIAVSPVGKGAFSSFVHRESFFLPPQCSLCLITPSVDLTDAAVFLNLKQGGFSPVLFYLVRDETEPAIGNLLRSLREAGIRIHVLPATGWGTEQ